MNETTKNPIAYLSNTNGNWRVIWKGIPLNADTPHRWKAEAVAKKYGITLPDIIWSEGANGTAGWIEDDRPEIFGFSY